MSGAGSDRMARVAWFVWLLACLSAPVRATTLERLSLDDMILKSTAIIRGRVLSSQATVHKTLIYTHFQVQIVESWKGPAKGTVDVAVPGGSAGGVRQSFAGSPDLISGQEYLLFLWTGKTGLTHVIGLSQGAMTLGKDSEGNLVVTRGASAVTMLDRSTGQAVSDSNIFMRLRDMSERISATLAQGARR